MSAPHTHAPYRRIEDYAIIGDCRSAALVSRDGSIDWLCWPRFDSPSIFAGLLDPEVGGHFSIRAVGESRTKRAYRPDSNVLVTRVQTQSGEAEVTELFFASGDRQKTPLPMAMLIREVRCLAGEVEFDVEFRPRPQYGEKAASLRSRGPGSITFPTRDGLVHLASEANLQLIDGSARASLSLRAGERSAFILSLNENGPGVFPPIHRSEDLIEQTDRYWRTWSDLIVYEGRRRDQLVRSALALKLLFYSPSGAVVAAPTTSLPEKVGATYNWDYRYCWLRDASFTVDAFLGLGLLAEAGAFLQWLLHTTNLTRPELQVVYGVTGNPLLKERTLEHLAGYRHSKPVRVGNGAHDQKQLDIYGEVVGSAARCYEHGIAFSGDERALLRGLAKYVLGHWRDPDAGIWETRLGDLHHVHSKVMCWRALDRAAWLAERGELHLDPGRLREAAAEIRRTVIDEGFSDQVGAYTSVLGGAALDASVLRLALVGFEDASGERMARTVEAVRSTLGEGDLVYRHRGEETAGEGAFLLCSFWMVQCLALQGRVDEAERMFDALLARANDVGLFPEEIDGVTGEFLGNFPQAFTHVGVINAGLALEKAKTGAGRSRVGHP